MGFRVKGMKQADAGCSRLIRELPKAAGESVVKSTQLLSVQSGIQVPKDTGALFGTRRYVWHSKSGPRRSRGVKYGMPGDGPDPLVDYAAAVHEELKASHAPPTKAKYVEDPLVQGVVAYRAFTRVECQKAVKRAFR